MSQEGCAICGTSVPFKSTVHLLINTKFEEGVSDYYICESCYREDIEPLFVDSS